MLALGGISFSVLDLSKTGICFAASRRLALVVGDRFNGMLSLDGSTARPVSGRVVRRNSKSVAVRFESAIQVDVLAPTDTSLRGKQGPGSV